jgi:hypothetical protein
MLAGLFADIARALDFEDDDPHPHGGLGLVYGYEINTKAGCLPHRLAILSGNETRSEEPRSRRFC